MFQTHAFPIGKETGGNSLGLAMDWMCGTSAQVTGQEYEPAGTQEQGSARTRSIGSPLHTGGPSDPSWQPLASRAL